MIVPVAVFKVKLDCEPTSLITTSPEEVPITAAAPYKVSLVIKDSTEVSLATNGPKVSSDAEIVPEYLNAVLSPSIPELGRLSMI